MNTINWNKQDYIVVAETLKGNDIMFYKGIFFIKVREDADDQLIQYLLPINTAASGANATALVRSILASSHARFPSTILEFILNNSNETQTLIPAVVLNKNVFSEKTRPYLNFIITHEVGHVLLGHLDPAKEPVFGSEACIENEIAADGFVNLVLGTNENTIDFLTTFLKHVRPKIELITDEAKRLDVEKGLMVIERRLGAVL